MARSCLKKLLSIIWTTSFVQAQCYDPGGDSVPGQLSCDPGANPASCCPVGWTCFSNKLCIVRDQSAAEGNFPLGTTIRGTCTTSSWNNSACGTFCLDGPDSANNGSLQSCGEDKWCCGQAVAAGTCDCETGDGTFSIAAGIAQTTIGVPASSTTPSTPTHNGNTLSSSGLSPSATGQAASKASAPPVPSTHKAGFKAGISILVVIVVLGLLATGFFFWRRRQRRNELLAPPQNDDDSDIFNMQAMASVFSNARLEPDPYQLPSPSHIPRGPSRTSGPDPTRFSPPINDPYQYPYGRT